QATTRPGPDCYLADCWIQNDAAFATTFVSRDELASAAAEDTAPNERELIIFITFPPVRPALNRADRLGTRLRITAAANKMVSVAPDISVGLNPAIQDYRARQANESTGSAKAARLTVQTGTEQHSMAHHASSAALNEVC
ncbi:hypothetical protein, partial [Nocardia cyriacigeorgica]|uniref:hypothetical protein n=1 Tax=Nocardia cyriacigeorgica TaxID=135487 RepID=UPI001C498F9D